LEKFIKDVVERERQPRHGVSASVFSINC
jgi:hypothetical protein